MDQSNEIIPTVKEADKNTNKKTSYNWLIWWNVDEDELKKQVDQYKTLSIWKSARGQAALALVLSAIITSVFILVKIIPNFSYLDVSIFLLLALFINMGYRSAMIGAMIFWTFEKIYSIASSFAFSSAIVNIIWWIIYMNFFWLAYKTEVRKIKEIPIR